ncbi:MAG TPA: glycosyltransferase [Mycobacteriales bacterium]|nr:glycosyltransferase [Mycobacteriales bacterium]
MAATPDPVAPRVGVVVASRDRPDMVDRCLASVRTALSPHDELVLVDSASRDQHRPAYAEAAARHGAQLVRLDEPGVNRARNAGWRATTAPLVLFTDDDVEVEQGWVDAYLTCFAEHPEATFATGWLAAPEEAGQSNDVAVLDATTPRAIDRSARGVLGHGASMAVSRDALVAVGGWDEALGAGARFRAAPEVDLYDRLLHAGHLGRFEPRARARHHQWRSVGQLAALHFRYGLGSGARMAKLARYDRRRLLHAAREAWWAWGLKELWEHVRTRNERRAAIDVVRMAGYVLGFVEALGTPVKDGLFLPRARR